MRTQYNTTDTVAKRKTEKKIYDLIKLHSSAMRRDQIILGLGPGEVTKESLKRHVDNYLHIGATLDQIIFVERVKNLYSDLKQACTETYPQVRVKFGDIFNYIIPSSDKIYLLDFDGTESPLKDSIRSKLDCILDDAKIQNIIIVGSSRRSPRKDLDIYTDKFSLNRGPRYINGKKVLHAPAPTSDCLRAHLRTKDSYESRVEVYGGTESGKVPMVWALCIKKDVIYDSCSYSGYN